jgi:hypothetical protein
MDSDCIPLPGSIAGYLVAEQGALAYAGQVKALHNDEVSQYYDSQEILIPRMWLRAKNKDDRFTSSRPTAWSGDLRSMR